MQDEIKSLLQSDASIEIEKQICERLNVKLYRDDLDILVGFMQNEILISGVSLEELELFLNQRRDLIIALATLFLKDKSIEQLSIGISITYAIYLFYLMNQEDDLDDYLSKRRIPDWKSISAKLIHLKSKLNI